MQTNELVSSPTNAPQRKDPNKWLIIGLIISILAALGMLGVFVYQNYQLRKQIEKLSLNLEIIPTILPVKEGAAGWKIYKNSEYGYTIKYPPNFFLQEVEDRAYMLQFADFIDKKYEKVNGEFPVIQVAVYNDEELSLEEWFKKYATTEPIEVGESPEIYYYKVTTKQEISINGIKGLKFIDNKITDAPSPTAIFSGKSVVVSISGYYFVHDESVQNIYDLMLSTFEFTNSSEEESIEPLSYSTSGVSAYVLKKTVSFDYTAEQLEKMAEECGSQHNAGYFDQLVLKFSGVTKIIYNFIYTGAGQESGAFVVTVLPNKANYSSLDEFKKDFDQCYAGGDAYPAMMNKNWLLFVNSCGTGFDDGSDRPVACQEVRDAVEPTLKLISTPGVE